MDLDGPRKLNLVHWSMKWGRGQMKTVRRAWGPCKIRTKYCYPITHNKKEINITKNLNFFSMSQWTIKMRSRTMDIWQTDTSLHKASIYKVWSIQVFHLLKYKSFKKLVNAAAARSLILSQAFCDRSHRLDKNDHKNRSKEKYTKKWSGK